MEYKSLDEKVKFWNRLVTKAFPFIKKIILDEKRDSIIFMSAVIDFISFAKYINEEVTSNFLYLFDYYEDVDSVVGPYFYLGTVFGTREAKDKANEFQEHLNTFFNKILMDHVPEEYKVENEVVVFFKFHSASNEKK